MQVLHYEKAYNISEEVLILDFIPVFVQLAKLIGGKG